MTAIAKVSKEELIQLKKAHNRWFRWGFKKLWCQLTNKYGIRYGMGVDYETGEIDYV